MATNLWPNADLETNIDDWNPISSAALVHSDTEAYEQTYSLRVTPTTSVWGGTESECPKGARRGC